MERTVMSATGADTTFIHKIHTLLSSKSISLTFLTPVILHRMRLKKDYISNDFRKLLCGFV